MSEAFKIRWFVKFLERRFLEEFISTGKIYMNTVDHFKKIESDQERCDPNENITGYFQPNMVKITIGDRELKDFAGPITLYDPNNDQHYTSHIYCMTYISDPYTLRSDLRIFDERMASFESVALLKPKFFMEKIVFALEHLKEQRQIYDFSCGLVKYVSKNSYSGDMDIFKKTDDYSHQQEFRIAVSAVDRSKPLILNLGSLEKIALGIDLSIFENRVEVDESGNLSFVFN